MKIPVKSLGQATQALVDSVITASRNGTGDLTVVYAFDNPCGDSITGFTRIVAAVVEVRFEASPRESTDRRIDEPRACPAAIVFQAYAITVPVPPGQTAVRGFVGGVKDPRLVRELSVQ